ncbi:MAG: cupin domain-containing protein [Alphaproteobacteria bacterium]|nr:cupin domain-containing protein [Alphaproteobacteria bacterium]
MLQRLPTPDGKRSDTAFTHGTMEVKLYAPRGGDPQQPHDRDEVYVVMYGSGTFDNGGQRRSFRPGDLLFVPAGIEHRFEGFTDDLVVWVVFYGPRGGEGPR